MKAVDEYISGFPENIQNLLTQMRATIKMAAPDAEECISYQMPAYKLNGMLVYFAGYKNHISLYPTSAGIEAFKAELSNFKCSKGTIHFSICDPLPVELIAEIVKFRVISNQTKTKKKPGSES